jgi:UDP-2,3-diacylglucosamine hydrolase
MTDTLLSLPRFWEVTAAPSWKAIDFISDLHLSQDAPLTFEAFSQYLLNTQADAVFILGDLFNAWLGDDSRYEGFAAQCTEALAAGAALRAVAFMAGNRDFLVGTDMLGSCGVMALADPAVLVAFERRLMLCHGDVLCLADLPYQVFRKEVRRPEWQAHFLGLPLENRQLLANQMRAESQRRHELTTLDDEIDIDTPTAVAWMHEAGTPVMVHGHTHRAGSEPMAPGFVRHVLSDWDLDGAHGPARAEVLRLTKNGLRRLSLNQV